MTKTTPAPLRPPVDEYTGPPKRLFIDEDWHERDLEAVYRPRWLVAGHVSELDADPSGRGYMTFALGEEEVLIRRDETGRVRAYHNFAPTGAPSCVKADTEPPRASGSSARTTPGRIRPSMARWSARATCTRTSTRARSGWFPCTPTSGRA